MTKQFDQAAAVLAYRLAVVQEERDPNRREVFVRAVLGEQQAAKAKGPSNK